MLASLEAQAQAADSTDGIPDGFLAFCAWLGVEVTEGQADIAARAYDDETRHPVVVVVAGRRAGKSRILGGLRLLHGMLTRDVTSCAPGQIPTALVVAPNDTLRAEVLQYARGAVDANDTLRPMLRKSSSSSFDIQRPDGRVIRFATGVATAGGYGARGRSLTDCMLDEVAFFRDRSAHINDEDIFRAALPGILPGGQMIVASTPWAEKGLLYELWSRNREKSIDAIVFHAPTLALRPEAADIVARETARDPDNARREFGAEFMRGGTEVFFDRALIESCVDDAQTLPRVAHPGDVVMAGADFGFRSDSSALVVAHRTPDNVIRIGELVELLPEPGKPLKPSETVGRFATTIAAHGAGWLMADGHYREAIVEHLANHSLAFADAPGTPADAYVRVRALMREGRVRLPRHARLLHELGEVEGRATPGGRMAITLPRWARGGHCDLVSALVLALYQLGGDEVGAPAPEKGTAEWEEAERAKRRREKQEAADRDWWRGPKPKWVGAPSACLDGRVARAEARRRSSR